MDSKREVEINRQQYRRKKTYFTLANGLFAISVLTAASVMGYVVLNKMGYFGTGNGSSGPQGNGPSSNQRHNSGFNLGNAEYPGGESVYRTDNRNGPFSNRRRNSGFNPGQAEYSGFESVSRMDNPQREAHSGNELVSSLENAPIRGLTNNSAMTVNLLRYPVELNRGKVYW